MSDLKPNKVGFFEESENVKSFTRLASGILIFVGVIIAVIGVVFKIDALATATALIGFGVGNKVGNKIAEKPDTNVQVNTMPKPDNKSVEGK